MISTAPRCCCRPRSCAVTPRPCRLPVNWPKLPAARLPGATSNASCPGQKSNSSPAAVWVVFPFPASMAAHRCLLSPSPKCFASSVPRIRRWDKFRKTSLACCNCSKALPTNGSRSCCSSRCSTAGGSAMPDQSVAASTPWTLRRGSAVRVITMCSVAKSSIPPAPCSPIGWPSRL
ncbi:hypothetical protein D3C72_1429100 [compost metagenome]